MTGTEEGGLNNSVSGLARLHLCVDHISFRSCPSSNRTPDFPLKGIPFILPDESPFYLASFLSDILALFVDNAVEFK